MRVTEKVFWSRVERSESPAVCWPWKQFVTDEGYGVVSYAGQKAVASRVAWMLVYGAIPSGMCVRHTCGNRACCNPAHMALGVPTINKGRGGTPSQRLSDAQMEQIRQRYLGNQASRRLLAQQYGVSVHRITAVINTLPRDSPCRKLSAAQVAELRRLRVERGLTLSELARRYRVAKSTVFSLVRQTELN